MSRENVPTVWSTEPGDDGWDRGWEEHKRRQLIRMSKLTLGQKLQWLEVMQVLYEKLAKSRRTANKQTKSKPLQ